MSKQTALQWLIEQVHSDEYTHAFGRTYISIYLIEQAIEMEKEQIVDAFGVGCQVESTRLIGYQGMSEQYYTSTYGQ
jgi:hypothetical protein